MKYVLHMFAKCLVSYEFCCNILEREIYRMIGNSTYYAHCICSIIFEFELTAT